MTVTAKPITAEELFAMGDIGRCELIRGEVVRMAPAGAEHGDIGMEIAYRIKAFVAEHDLGRVYNSDTGFIVARKPDTVRAPDVAFVGKERIPHGPIRGFFPGAPDLAVEVVSPSDSLSDVSARVDQWLAAGTTSVWVVDPPNRTIAIYRAGNQVTLYRETDELREEPTLPGFTLPVRSVFNQ